MAGRRGINRRVFLMGMVAVVGATAFAFLRLPSQAGGLPEVRLGVDKCAYCGMIIVDVRFA
ncbi:MAG: hypothetical protein QXW94_05440, partial [Desulfurococcaceae archaeon]